MTRALLLPFALLAVILSACVAQPAGPGDVGTGGGDWGSRTDIEAIFQNDCSQCHGTAWSSCWAVQEEAGEVQGAIEAGAMPRGNAMAPADKAAVLAWLAAGATCAGSEPDGGVPLPGSGGGETP